LLKKESFQVITRLRPKISKKYFKETQSVRKKVHSSVSYRSKLDPALDSDNKSQTEETEGLVTSLILPKPDDPLPASEIERLQKNKLGVEYYQANKEKIQASRKKRKAEVNAARCVKEGIPDYLGQFIRFGVDGSYTLTFKNNVELTKTLHWLKFKSQYKEDIFTQNRK